MFFGCVFSLVFCLKRRGDLRFCIILHYKQVIVISDDESDDEDDENEKEKQEWARERAREKRKQERALEKYGITFEQYYNHRNNRHRMRDDDKSCLHFFTVRALLNAPY